MRGYHMGLNRHKLKKWANMILGNSSYHVNQDEGKTYSKTEIEGYYNNLTEKITKFGLPGNEIPITTVDTGEKLHFPIAIFQYGLAAYDLYLLKKGDIEEMKSKVIACADWAVENQQDDGSWITFAYENPEHPYSSMAQGEGISLLIRAYKETGDCKYSEAARKALIFMLVPLHEGGTTKYEGDDVYFFECTEDPLILNGWIFSLWGVIDYCKFFDDENTKSVLEKAFATLERRLPDFDIGYWSMYEDGKRISSPFYHSLHIAQLNVMYKLTDREIYKRYAEKFDMYQRNLINKGLSFAVKAWQKVWEK